MTRKHFKLIAKVLYEAQDRAFGPEEHETINRIIEEFADELKQTNPLFKKDTFMKAAGFTQG